MAIALVQSVSAAHDGTTGSVTTAGITTSTGNAIFIVLQNGNQNSSATISDNKGNTYALALDSSGSFGGRLRLYYKLNAAGGAGHTFTQSGMGVYAGSIIVQEYSGITSAGELDVTKISSAASGAITTGNSVASTIYPNQLVIGFAASNNVTAGNMSAGSGYGNFVASIGATGTNPRQAAIESKVVSATGVQAATFTTTVNDSWAAGVATFSDVQIPRVPTPTVTAASSITKTTATLNGNLTSEGTQDVTKRGFVYGVTSQPVPTAGLLPNSTPLLSDNFNDNSISGSWSTVESATNTIFEINNRVEITHAATSQYNTMIATSAYNLTGAGASVQIVDAGNQTIPSHEAILGVRLSNIDGNDVIWMTASNGFLMAWKRTGGTQSQIGASITYSPTAHAYVRIREQSGSIYFDTSPDNQTWTNRWSTANPFAVTSIYPFIQSGCWQNEASASYAYFDNFNFKATTTDYTNYFEETGSYSTGVHSAAVTGLPKNSTIYVRSFAYSSVGGYIYSSTEQSFTVTASTPIIDKVSDVDTGFLNTVTPADTSPFNSGEKISYTGDALSAGTYYYRVRVKDPSGSNNYSAWSETRTFTISGVTKTAVKLTKSAGYYIRSRPAATTKSLRYQISIEQSGIAKSLAYYVQGKLSNTKALNYRVFIYATITKSLSYRVQYEQTAINKSLKYVVQAEAAPVAKSLGYAVLSDVSISKAIRYVIHSTHLNTLAVRYDVFTLKSISKSSKYSVRADGLQTRSGKYAILTTKAISKGLAYSVANIINLNKALGYSIETGAGLNKAAQYSIQTTENVQKTQEYAVKSTKNAEKTQKYAILDNFRISLAMNYIVNAFTGLDLVLKYSLLNPNQSISRDLTYTVKSDKAIVRTSAYRVVTPAGTTRALGYYVQGDSPNVLKSLKYCVILHKNAEKTQKYAILLQKSAVKPLEYRLNIERLLEQSLRYEVQTVDIVSKPAKYAIMSTPDVLHKSLAYHVYQTVFAQYPLQYSIVDLSCLTSPIQYKVRRTVTAQRSMKYVVVSVAKAPKRTTAGGYRIHAGYSRTNNGRLSTSSGTVKAGEKR